MKSVAAKPLVTIAISFYNNQDTLRDAITSVLNQNFDDWELILINDGSTDKSLDVAKKFVDHRITLVSDGENRGLVARLNQSASLARGKYYARMDADDIMHPDRLDQQVRFLNENPKVDAVDTGMYIMNREGQLTGVRNEPYSITSLSDVLHGKVLNHATVMGHTSWFKLHHYDPIYIRAEDVELWCRALDKSSFARLEQSLYFVREGKVNIKNYVRSQSTMRRIYRNYGPRALSWWQIQVLILKSTVKAVIYTFMGAIGMQEVLTKHRNKKMSPPILMEAEQTLSLALGHSHQPLPVYS